MCALVLLLLVLGAADCGRPHPPPNSLEYQPSPDYELRPLLPLPLSRETFERPRIKTSRPSDRNDFAEEIEVGDQHLPRLRTNIQYSRGSEGDHRVQTNKNDRDATHASLQEPVERNRETVRQHRSNETSLVSKFNPSDRDEEESTWVWGTSDAGESKNTTAVDDLDDRTSIAGANCPTGQVKIHGKCVDKH